MNVSHYKSVYAAVVLLLLVLSPLTHADAPVWRTFDLGLQTTTQESGASVNPRLRYLPYRAREITPRVSWLVGPQLGFAILKTASGGRLGELTLGGTLGLELDHVWSALVSVGASSWSANRGSAFFVGPEFGYRLHSEREGWRFLDRAFVSISFVNQSPSVREYVVGVSFKF